MERMLTMPSFSPSSSSSFAASVPTCDGGNELPSGWVGGCNWTVALGSAMVGAPAARGRPGEVGAAVVARRMVGAGAPAGGGAPAVRSGIVGAGGRGGPPGTVAVGGPPGMGGLTGGVIGTVDDGTAGGASAAFKVTRTVSFLRGTLDVCLDGVGG
jgi:hypothetical protein